MISDFLMRDRRIHVQPINHPTVPKGTERPGLTPGPLHGDGEIDHPIAALTTLWRRRAIARSVA